MANFNRQRTCLDIVQDVLGQLGLPIPQQVASNETDVTAQQMFSLLNFCGRRLLKPTNGRRWQILNRTWQLVTVPGQTLYDLPADWDSFIDVTGWNQTTRLPMLGPALDTQWAAMKGRLLGPTTLSIVYRTRGGQFELYFSPSTAQTLNIDYTSRAWVSGTDSGVPVLKDAMTDDADLCLYDGELITAYLKLRFLIEKGFDTTVALSDFDQCLQQAQNADTDAPWLSTGHQPGFPLINNLFNLPDTGFGL